MIMEYTFSIIQTFNLHAGYRSSFIMFYQLTVPAVKVLSDIVILTMAEINSSCRNII